MASTVMLVGDGRMGALVREVLEGAEDFRVVGQVGEDTADQLDAGAPAADVAIDFSNVGMLPHLVAYARRCGCAVVSGTTGLSDAQLDELRALGQHAPVIHSGNYSLGVAVLRHLTQEAAASLGGWDPEIVETHHAKKVDAPSGTALMLLRAIDPAGTRPVSYGREGMVGERPAEEIGMHSLRGGTVAGTHEVHFFGPDEELVLTHRATSRRIFAEGAVAATKRLLRRGPGFYTFDELMFD